MTKEEFIKNVRKVNSPRIHKVTNSWGVYDYYKYYRKTKPKEKKYVLSESQYFYIIRQVNLMLRDALIKENKDIVLPHRLGTIEIRKTKANVEFKDNKLKTNLQIDWDKTLQLWFEDEEYYRNKTLIRIPEEEIFKIFYNRASSNYNNKSYYQFTPVREFKLALKKAIKENNFDSFSFN